MTLSFLEMIVFRENYKIGIMYYFISLSKNFVNVSLWKKDLKYYSFLRNG